jgi:hypothetical protein
MYYQLTSRPQFPAVRIVVRWADDHTYVVKSDCTTGFVRHCEPRPGVVLIMELDIRHLSSHNPFRGLGEST